MPTFLRAVSGLGTRPARGRAAQPWGLLCALLALGCARRAGPTEATLVAYAKAAAAYDAGRVEEAMGLARQVSVADAGFYPAWVLLGKAAYFSDSGAAAIAAFERALAAAPRAGEAGLWLARSYRAAGDTERAERALGALLSSDPSSIAALRLAASLSFESGDIAGSWAYIERAVEASAEAGLAFADRAALRWAAGDAQGALADLDAAILTLPQRSSAREAAAALRGRISGATP